MTVRPMPNMSVDRIVYGVRSPSRWTLMIVPPAFASTEMSVLEQNGVLITTLSAPSTKEDDFYLMLQRSGQYTEQDKKLGMNKPYIEYCGQGCSWYGEILTVELLHDRVRIRMSRTAAEHMQNDGRLEVSFALSAPEFRTLQGALRRTFDGESYFVERV